MTSEETKLAVQEQKISDLTRRIEKLEQNQKWGVTMILGLVFATLFDFIKKGYGQ